MQKNIIALMLFPKGDLNIKFSQETKNTEVKLKPGHLYVTQ